MIYQKKHSQEYQLHEYEKEELTSMGIRKLPSAEKILSEIENLQNQQVAERASRQKLIKQQSELSAIQSNFEDMLMTSSVSIERATSGVSQRLCKPPC